MSKKRKILLSLPAIVLLSMFSNLAMASSCDPVIGQNVIDGKNSQIENDKEQELSKTLPEGTSDLLSGCTNIWPTADFGFSLPSISDTLKKMGEEAMNKACNTAREKINEQVSKAQQSVSLDTSSISGFSELGIGNVNFGSASVSTGTSSTGGVTQNGSSWNNITSSFK